MLSAPWTDRNFLQVLLAAAPIAIALIDATGRILYANPKLQEMFDYSYDELVGDFIELLIPERFRMDHLFHREEYASNPRVRPMGSGLDLAGRRRDGSEFPLEVGLSFVGRSEDLLVIASVTDITKRKHTEDILERRVEERTRELERRREVSDGLRDILAVLNSNQSLEEILNHITEQACRLLHADASAIFRLHGDQGRLSLQASHGLPDEYANRLYLPPAAMHLAHGDAGRSASGADFHDYVPADHTSTPTVLHTSDAINIISAGAPDDGDEEFAEAPTMRYRAVFSVPLVIKEEVYGNLTVYYREPRKFTAEELELAAMMGDQTALAIENARLRTQVERTAVAAERSRIARDLHDSVTQTLFSASLIAEVLPRLWDRSRPESEKRLDELRQLTRGALAEMRTLLLELRPATLIEVELSELLRQLTEAIMGRARVPITLDMQGTGSLPPDVKIAFYHIAQEALNNVAKHAQASHVEVTLKRRSNRAHLSVKDNGRGFVIDKVTPEHLGLTIMHERAEAIGARLEIESRLEHGTTVTVAWRRP